MRDEIAKISVDVCTTLKIEDHTVCSGVISLFKDEVLTVFEKVGLGSDEACNIVVGDSCSKGYDPWHQKWSVPIPGDKPPVTHHSPEPGSPVTGVLHITDIHYDPLYTPGLTRDCGEPLCCRPPNAQGNSSTAAGYWGDYKCDVPYQTLLNLMEHLQKQGSMYEWVYWTGDMPAHSVWTTTRQGLLDMMTNITDLMSTSFGGKPVFPTYGNHEGVPVNSFPPPYITGNMSAEWLYSGSAERWAVWLDKFPEWPTINATIRKGGYYVVKVREHLKVISLQTNFCNTDNYWLLINSTDPAGQLQYLVEQLLQAERDGDKVHIIGHIAPGLHSCNPVWSSNYHLIVNRFESTIVGQFFGHTHHDSVEIHYDDKNVSRATNVVYISQSVTTYQYLNLGYRIFIIDGDYDESTSCVVDHVNYYMDLSKTSETTPPLWEFEYSAKADYEMADLQPQSWADLVLRFQKNNTLFMKYYQYVVPVVYMYIVLSVEVYLSRYTYCAVLSVGPH
jgi:sphingomyelin phosphodiesterase